MGFIRESFDLQELVPPHKDPDYKRAKMPNQKFSESEQLFIDSIRFKTTWLHSFFLYAVIWAFGINLKEEYKGEFEEWLKANCVESEARKKLLSKAAKISDSDEEPMGS